MEAVEQLKRRVIQDVENISGGFKTELAAQDYSEVTPRAATPLRANQDEKKRPGDTRAEQFCQGPETQTVAQRRGVSLYPSPPVSRSSFECRDVLQSADRRRHKYSSTSGLRKATSSTSGQMYPSTSSRPNTITTNQSEPETVSHDLESQINEFKKRLKWVERELATYKQAYGSIYRGYEAEKRLRTELSAEVERLRQKHKHDKALVKSYRAASDRWRARLHTHLDALEQRRVPPQDFNSQSSNNRLAERSETQGGGTSIAHGNAHINPEHNPMSSNKDQYVERQIPDSTEVSPIDYQPSDSGLTTEDDAPVPRILADGPNEGTEEDDEPVVVSSRVLKRKRQDPASLQTKSHWRSKLRPEGSSEQPPLVKREELSPVQPLSEHRGAMQDSNHDLDADIDPLATPQKKRMERMDRIRRRLEVPLPSERTLRATSDPLDLVPGIHSQVFEPTEGSNNSSRSFGFERGDQPHPISNGTAVLQNLPLNCIVSEDAAEHEQVTGTIQRRNKNRSRQTTKTDARPPEYTSIKLETRLTPVQKKRKNSSRISTLLEDISVERTSLGPSVTALDHAKQLDKAEVPLPHVNIKKEIIKPHDNPPLAGKFTKPRKTSRKSEPIPRTTREDSDGPNPDDEPLRARPTSRLSLQDFKINPRTNQGISFAYSEPVRTIEGKRCLPGCTDPSCCGGTFRALAAVAGDRLTAKRGLWDDSQSDAEQALLEEYLGDDRARLGRMPAAERAELLLQAQAAKLAQQHGKHRTAHARRSTPAGYWDADWPSTQQAAENREKTSKTTREMVAERRAEAMRTNGRWMFRDE